MTWMQWLITFWSDQSIETKRQDIWNRMTYDLLNWPSIETIRQDIQKGNAIAYGTWMSDLWNLNEWLMELEWVTYGFWMTYNLLIWQRDKTSGIEWLMTYWSDKV